MELDLAKREELYQELDTLVKARLGDNKYAIIVAYEAINMKDQNEVEFMDHILTNIDNKSSLYVWKWILVTLTKRLQDFNNVYDYKNNMGDTDGK